jgi:hypothetical protein
MIKTLHLQHHFDSLETKQMGMMIHGTPFWFIVAYWDSIPDLLCSEECGNICKKLRPYRQAKTSQSKVNSDRDSHPQLAARVIV